jgi:membrane protease YdiL (CAAX protease family)
MIAIAILLTLLWRLGWLRAAGLARFGRRPVWLAMLLLVPYVILVPLFALTGRLDLPAALPALAGPAVLFYLAHAFLEEIVFRGLILLALVQAWGRGTRGFVKSLVVSSLFFAAMHLLNVLGGNSLPLVLLQSAGAFFLGIAFAALVLAGGSVYPAALLHGAANAAAYLSLTATPEAATTASAWLLQSALMVPLAAVGLAILRGMGRPESISWRLQNER